MKVFQFFAQMQQEAGDQLQNRVIHQDLALTLPDGFDMTREDPTGNENFVYHVTGPDTDFKFTILPPVVVEGMKIPSAVILREKGDDKEGTLET